VARACLEGGVSQLIQTSTSNVCVSEGLVSLTMDETSPMVDAASSPNHYGWTKVQAEQEVLRADQPGGMRAVAVRPCSGIFGPTDAFITEQFLRDGECKIFIPGSTIDYVYVENVVLGHLLAEAALNRSPDSVGGEAFCISQDEPILADNLYRSLDYFFEERVGTPMKMTYLPHRLMRGLAYLVEAYQAITHRRVTGQLSSLTPAMIHLAGMSYAFSSCKARRLLGYEPLYTIDEALQRTVATSKHLYGRGVE